MKNKKRFTFIFTLFVLFFISVLFVRAAEKKCDPKYFEEVAGVCVPTSESTGLSDTPVADIIKNFMLWILGIFGFFGVIGFVISGIQYLTAAGEERQIETAKRNMKWSLVGVIVALSGIVIIKAVEIALKANSVSF